MSVVLMYHALYRGSDTSSIDPEDLPYAVSEAEFAAQIQCLAVRQTGLFRVGEQPEIVLSFDDGHRSNLDIAAPLLESMGIPAYFFLTTDFIDRRPGFLTSRQVSELAAVPGMCIGSHGMSHRFFDDLDSETSWLELLGSREHLESLTGRECRSISFPGGRYSNKTLTRLTEAGYRQWFGSDVDTVVTEQVFDSHEASLSEPGCTLATQLRLRPVERIAVRRTTTLDEFSRMIRQDEAYFNHHRRRGRVKYVARSLLGNRLYHGLYKSLSVR